MSVIIEMANHGHSEETTLQDAVPVGLFIAVFALGIFSVQLSIYTYKSFQQGKQKRQKGSFSCEEPCDKLKLVKEAPPHSGLKEESAVHSEAEAENKEHNASSKKAAPPVRRSLRAEAASAEFIDQLTAQHSDEFAQVRSIAEEAFGDGSTVGRNEKIALLKLEGQVIAYASYNIRPNLQSFNVNKLAVPASCRRRGFGRALLRHLISLAKRPAGKAARGSGKGQLPLEVICLSALPTAINFYVACGFHKTAVKLPEDDGDLIEGQVYMEYRLRRRRS